MRNLPPITNMKKINCIENKMGDWTYYLATLSFADAADTLKFAHEVNKRTDLDHLIQRELTSRSQEIAQYLTSQSQRLFGALICASFGKPIDFKSTGENVGQLTLDDESIYVLDGQHRLAAIKEVVQSNPNKFKSDFVPILLVFHHKTDPGYARARRLFTTVNRYAKQTSKSTNRVMDEDDGISFLLLRLIREFMFWSKRIKCTRTNKKKLVVLANSESMGKADSAYLMSVSSFYEVIFNLLPTGHKPGFVKLRKAQTLPQINVLDDAYGEVEIRLDELCQSVVCWKELEQNKIPDLTSLRNNLGGHPLVRPVAIIPFSLAFNEAREANVTINHIKNVVNTYSDLSRAPWIGFLWDPTGKRMHGGQEVKRLAYRVWRVLLGLTTKQEKSETNELWRAKVDPQNANPHLSLP